MNPDDTIRIQPAGNRISTPQSPRPKRRLGIIAAVVIGVAVLITLGISVARRSDLPIASERMIAFNHPDHIMVFRLRADPLVIVVDCPSLHAQGLMFDRIAALIEKADAPRGQVVSWSELAATAAMAHQTIGTYYYGNDYSAHSLRKFFRLAKRDHRKLNKQEIKLRTLLRRIGYLQLGATGAVISLPAAGPGKRISMHARAVILRHEISHGAFFTLAFYRSYTQKFWTTILNHRQRNAFRAFLGREGYDVSNQTLMMNETQAYLVFTRDRQFFSATAVGLSESMVRKLRTQYIAAMPNFWLKTLANEPLPQ